MVSAKEKDCLICRGKGEEGLKVAGGRICPACEKKIMAAEAGSVHYEDLIKQIRLFWQDNIWRKKKTGRA